MLTGERVFSHQHQLYDVFNSLLKVSLTVVNVDLIPMYIGNHLCWNSRLNINWSGLYKSYLWKFLGITSPLKLPRLPLMSNFWIGVFSSVTFTAVLIKFFWYYKEYSLFCKRYFITTLRLKFLQKSEQLNTKFGNSRM